MAVIAAVTVFVVYKTLLCTGAVINMLVEVLVIDMWVDGLTGVIVDVIGVDMPTGEKIIVGVAAVIALEFAMPVLYAVDVLSGAVVDLLTDVNVNILAAVVTVLEFPTPETLGKLSC